MYETFSNCLVPYANYNTVLLIYKHTNNCAGYFSYMNTGPGIKFPFVLRPLVFILTLFNVNNPTV